MSPMKLDAGGNPWRRKPSAPPAVIAARTPAALRSSDSAITARVPAEMTQTPAARPSTPSVRLMTFTIATMPSTVRTSPRSIEPITSTLSGSTPPTNGSVNALTVTPADTGMIVAPIWPRSLSPAGRSKMSSITPTSAIATAPIRIARTSSPFWPGPSGRKSSPATRTPTRIAQAAELRASAAAWRLRSFGMSIAPTLRATHSAAGTRSRARSAATPNA